jgi:Repeat of unknown function (DUF346)
MQPPRWTEIAAGVSSPAAVATGERRVTLFARGQGGDLLVLHRDGVAWSEPRSLGIPLARGPGAGSPGLPIDWPVAACSTGPEEIQLLARGAEGELVHGTLHGERWGGFECIGSPANWVGGIGVPMGLASAPSACSCVPGRMDVFAIGSAGALLSSHWDGKEFSEFESLGGVAREGRAEEPLVGSVSATSCGRAIAVAARGVPGDLIVKWWNGSSWTPFASLGMPQEPDPIYPAVPCPIPLAGTVVACGGGSRRLDVFARGQRGDLLHRWWDGKNWTGFESLGSPRSALDRERIAFTAGSVACAWSRFQLDVFARGADGKLYSLTWSGSGAIGGPESEAAPAAD